MKRIPEPELMDSDEQTKAYAAADFSEPNALFCQHVEKTLSSNTGRLLDLGCGSGGLLVQLANILPQWSMLGIDAGPNMLALAQHTIETHRLAGRVSLKKVHLPSDVDDVRALGPWDAIVSNSLLHHLADPMTLWRSIEQLGKAGTAVVVMDLMRPNSQDQAQAWVEAHAQGAADVLKQDFYNSLLAAWRLDEVEDQLALMGWQSWRIEQASNRHWVVIGHLD